MLGAKLLVIGWEVKFERREIWDSETIVAFAQDTFDVWGYPIHLFEIGMIKKFCNVLTLHSNSVFKQIDKAMDLLFFVLYAYRIMIMISNDGSLLNIGQE